MSDNNKKDPIERLFRRKARDYDISYNEADWMKLEDKLDLMDKQHAGRKRMRWMIAASILILSVLGYFTYENRMEINRISRQLSSETTPEIQQEHMDREDITPQRNRPPEEKESGGVIAEDRSAERKDELPPLQPSEDQASSQSGSDLQKTEAVPGANFMVTEGTGEQLYIPELSCTECDLSIAAASDEPEPLSSSRIGPPEPEISRNTALAAAFNNGLSSSFHSGDKVARQPPSRITLGLVISPDLSTVGSVSNFYDPGYKIGVKAEYNFTPDLSITAGIVQSEVRYKARGGDYKPPQGFWTNGTVPYETVGECLLIDIPVNLKYNVLHFDRSRFYATAGLSSYIMLTEDYRFDYATNETGLVQGWSGETGTRHWMSNASFSVGYEWDIHPDWSMRAEPFIKIPLKEVGWGNVKLYSLGSFISINYKF